MPIYKGVHNPGGFNLATGRRGAAGKDTAGVGITIDSARIKAMALDAANRFTRAQTALTVVHEELANDVMIEALAVLRERVAAGGRPQRETRGEKRYLEEWLKEPDIRRQAIIRLSGFTVPDIDALNRSKAGRYWRQVEQGATTTQELSGLFGLPPLVGGRVQKGSWEIPSRGSRSATKFAQFSGGRAKTITARVGPEVGYHYFQEGIRRARRKWSRGRAKQLYVREFRAQGLNFKDVWTSKFGSAPRGVGDLFIS